MQTAADLKNIEPNSSSIWVVIVNFHSQDLICRCIDSLKAHTQHLLNFVVVDNSLEPDTAKLELQFSDICIIRSVNNSGFAAGCNLGIQVAMEQGAEFVMLLNPDTYTTQDFLSPMLEHLQNSLDVGMAGPTIWYEKPSDTLWMAGSTKSRWGGARHILDDSLRSGKRPVSVPFMSGCCMLLRAKAIEQVGLMDERYFLYFEDADYCEAFQAKKWLISYVPEAELIHAASSTTGFQSESYVYYFSRNRLWFLRRWVSTQAFFFYLLFTVFVKIPGSIIIFALVRRKPKLSQAFIRGFIDGISGMKNFTRRVK